MWSQPWQNNFLQMELPNGLTIVSGGVQEDASLTQETLEEEQ